MASYPGQGNYYRPAMFGGFQFFPPVIKWLLITNAAVYVLIGMGGRMFTLDMMPLEIVFNYYLGLMPLGHGFYPWQLLTYQFMHANFTHLLYNMFGLWMFGMEVEHVWGSRKFLGFYLLCGVAAGISQLILAPLLEPSSVVSITGVGIPTVGASGAVYAVLVAFGMMFPDRYIYLYFLLPVKAKYFIFGLIALGVFSIGSQSAVANLAHLGGAAAGFVYVIYLSRRFPFQDTVERLGWWLNSRRSKHKEETYQETVEAKVFDINERPRTEQELNQMKIDEILDKISRGGYQSLTEEEKKILFEASKKLN
ncbi:MAG: rhomboid family intramembrane serine protease [Ignavibacteriales bacterium]|nr:rhomboid family intramembrane serine protease [Ignavibacteriales bacterium]